MNILKKMILLTVITILFLHIANYHTYAITSAIIHTPINAAVFLNNFNDPYIFNVKKSLEDIQKENQNKIQFTFFDSKSNQVIQNALISNALNNQKFDLFILNLVNIKIEEFQDIFYNIKQHGIPAILYSPPNAQLANFSRQYPNTIIIGGNDEQSGILQGKILVDAWNTNKTTIDKNKDDIMQYFMLQGAPTHPTAIARSKYSIQTLNDAGIKTQKISSTSCNWDRECGRNSIQSALLSYGDKIEVIIANNDDMAIGAIEALQKYGYNKGDKLKYIPVVGVDALPEAQESIKQGTMTGTVVQDPREHATALYAVGMNMASGNAPLSGTDYKFDETGNTIRIPYHEYKK